MAQQALVYGYVFDGKGGGRAIDLLQAESWQPEQGILWLHFDYTHPQARDWVENRAALDPLVAEALLQEESRPRTTRQGDGLLIALRGVNQNPGSNPEDMVGIRIWAEKNRIISTRRRRLLSAGDITAALGNGEGPDNTATFLITLADRLMERMEGTIADTEDQVASIEEQMLLTTSNTVHSQLSALRREVISLRRYLAPQREAMLQMQAQRVSWISDQERDSLREVTDHLIRYLEDLDSVRDRAAVAQEELTSRLSEQMNGRMYMLSLVAAIFLPLGFMTGLLGINVPGIPGTENPLAFWFFCLILTLVVIIQILIFKHKKWL